MNFFRIINYMLINFGTFILIFPCFQSFTLNNVDSDSETNDLMSQGRMQYQILRERGNLPKYGPCWKTAIEAVDEGCRELSEESQSDIALALTNCFLEMSGLSTYHCDTDKKENVRRICISSMSDRAFNVYTEFYTHTLNMCWFLRGQIWQETISENTVRVGRQLETSAAKQEKLLSIQRESLEIQERMLNHGKVIEHVLADLSVATENHQEMLLMMGQTINSLQSWLIGEVSWVNTVIFYILFGIFILIITSTPRTLVSRLPILVLLVMNVITERVICSLILSNGDFKRNAHDVYGDIHDCVQFLRYIFVTVCFIILIYKAYKYEDTLIANKFLLDSIHKQNQIILEKFQMGNSFSFPDKTYLVYKSNIKQSLDHHTSKDNIDARHSDSSSENYNLSNISRNNSFVSCITSRVKSGPKTLSNYNLRSRTHTPESQN